MTPTEKPYDKVTDRLKWIAAILALFIAARLLGVDPVSIIPSGGLLREMEAATPQKGK